MAKNAGFVKYMQDKGSLDSLERGTVEWWNSGMVE